MPLLPVIANIHRCAILIEDPTAQRAVNVLHIRGTGLTAEQVADNLDAALDGNMYGAMSSTCHLRLLTVTPLDGVSASFSKVIDHAGAGPDVGFIPQVAALVKLQTALRGREHRGRVFMPFTSEGSVANGQVAVLVVASIQSAWDDFVADLTLGASECHLVVASYKLASAEDVTTVLAEHQTATQRRRQERNR